MNDLIYFFFTILLAEALGAQTIAFPIVWILVKRHKGLQIGFANRFFVFGFLFAGLLTAVARALFFPIFGASIFEPQADLSVLLFLGVVAASGWLSANMFLYSKVANASGQWRTGNQRPQSGESDSSSGFNEKSDEIQRKDVDFVSETSARTSENIVRTAESPDEDIYLSAWNELKSKQVKKALWIKCMTLEDGDTEKAKYRYIRERVSQEKATRRTEEVTASQGSEAQVLASNNSKHVTHDYLTDDDLKYLKDPIRASTYQEKHKVSKVGLASAIRKGKIRAVTCNGVLWVQDKDPG